MFHSFGMLLKPYISWISIQINLFFLLHNSKKRLTERLTGKLLNLSGLSVHYHVLGISVEYFLRPQKVISLLMNCKSLVLFLASKPGMINLYTKFYGNLDFKNTATRIESILYSVIHWRQYLKAWWSVFVCNLIQ